MSRCGLPTGLVWLSERKQSPSKLFQGDTLSPNKVKQKKNRFSGIFYTFYGQRSVTAAWATRSPLSIRCIFTP